MTGDWHDGSRPGEIAVIHPFVADAGLQFIGRIHTPFLTRSDCPRQGRHDGPICRIEVDEPWRPGLRGIERFTRLEVLYWMDQSRRDLVVQRPRRDGASWGVFSLRSPARPNPIATSSVVLVGVDATGLTVRGLDCLDGTPLIDLKPDRSVHPLTGDAATAAPHGEG